MKNYCFFKKRRKTFYVFKYIIQSIGSKLVRDKITFILETITIWYS